MVKPLSPARQWSGRPSVFCPHQSLQAGAARSCVCVCGGGSGVPLRGVSKPRGASAGSGTVIPLLKAGGWTDILHKGRYLVPLCGPGERGGF